MEKMVFLKQGGFCKIGEQASYNTSFLNLVFFLEGEIGGDPIVFLSFLNDPAESGLRGNLIYMDKLDDKTVGLGSDLDEHPDPNEFRMPRDEFVRVVEEWARLCWDSNINEITLVYDEDAEGDKKVFLSGRFVDDVDERLKNKSSVIVWK